MKQEMLHSMSNLGDGNLNNLVEKDLSGTGMWSECFRNESISGFLYHPTSRENDSDF